MAVECFILRITSVCFPGRAWKLSVWVLALSRCEKKIKDVR